MENLDEFGLLSGSGSVAVKTYLGSVPSGSFANLKLTGDKLVKGQASAKIALELANAFIQLAKQRVKQIEEDFISTLTLCDQLSDTYGLIDYAANLIEEKEKMFKGQASAKTALELGNTKTVEVILLDEEEEVQNEDEKRRVKQIKDLITKTRTLCDQLTETPRQGRVHNGRNLIKEKDALEKQVCQLQNTLHEKEQHILGYKDREKELEDKIAELLAALFGAESKLSKVKTQYWELKTQYGSTLESKLSEVKMQYDLVLASKLSEVKMQYDSVLGSKQLEFLQHLKELSQRNHQAINDIWRKLGVENQADMVFCKWEHSTKELNLKANHSDEHEVQLRALKCQHEDESRKLQEELDIQKSKEDGPAPMHSSALKDDGGGSSGLSVDDGKELQRSTGRRGPPREAKNVASYKESGVYRTK
ncbi:hypothetical protein Vadar_023766 [Vaccinium darrowii]|uniref:Uncharacterized protein n=1 Tax=Vaccinium darrowii TaxID=229202 RepID=A0ACB7Z5U7_9ERIC|nr:hypothetical protein Vadar_023766 [Vaccinium darrowii]